MKKLTFFFFVLILTIMPISSSYGQLNYLVLANDRYCTTSECDVVLRQYTGLITAWRLSIRCFDSSGWASWHTWEGTGVYSGTLCVTFE